MAAEQTSRNKYLYALTIGLWKENPTFMLLIGMCPLLAVTIAVKPALTMGFCVIFVLVCSNLAVSLLRNLINIRLRIIASLLLIAVFVTIADLYLKAFFPLMSRSLGVYVPLIIANCIIIFRAEACAGRNNFLLSILDGIGTGAGFTIALCVLAGIREILASGTFFDIPVMPGNFVPSKAFQMPVGAFVTLGLLLRLSSFLTRKK